MSLEKRLKQKLEDNNKIPQTVHEHLFEPVPEPQVRKRRKRVLYTDTHTQTNIYIENSIKNVMSEILGDSWGEKSRFANEALKMYIQNKYPNLAVKLNDDVDSR